MGFSEYWAGDLWEAGLYTCGAAGYLVADLGIACALGRWCNALSHEIRPGHVRVLALILFAIGCIAPYVPLLFGADYGGAYSPWMITNPFATLAHLSESRVNSEFVVTTLGVLAAGVLLLNLLAIFRGLREVAFANVRSSRSAGADAAS